MPKPINPTLGTAPCPMAGCDETADIRRTKGRYGAEKGPLYLVCPDCGVIRNGGQKLQAHISQNGKFEDPEDQPEPPSMEPAQPDHEPEPDPAPAPDHEPEPDPAPAPDPEPERAGAFADWGGVFAE